MQNWIGKSRSRAAVSIPYTQCMHGLQNICRGTYTEHLQWDSETLAVRRPQEVGWQGDAESGSEMHSAKISERDKVRGKARML